MRKWIRRIAVWGLVIISLLAIAWTAVLMTGRQKLDDELAYWREQGIDIPIDAGFNIRTDETGTPRILRVIELYKAVPEATLELIDQPDEADPAELAEAVAACDGILKLIHEVAAEEQGVWRGEVIESRLWLGDLLPRLNHPRSIARLLDAQALTRAQAGDLDGACESIVAGLSIARQVGEHPAMIAVLVENAIIETMIGRFESVYAQGGVPTQALVDTLAQFDVEAMFVSTLQWEGVYMSRVTTGHVATPWSFHDTAYALRLYRGKMQDLDLHGFPLHSLSFDDEHPWWAMHARLIGPAFSAFQQQLVKAGVRIELAECAARLRRYKDRHGSYPEALENLEALGIASRTKTFFLYQQQAECFVISIHYENHFNLNKEGYVWEWAE